MKKAALTVTAAIVFFSGSAANAAFTHYFGGLKDDLKEGYTVKIEELAEKILQERKKVVLTNTIKEKQRIEQETEKYFKERTAEMSNDKTKEEIKTEADEIIKSVNEHIDAEMKKRGF